MTFVAHVDARRESEDGDDPPGAGERCLGGIARAGDDEIVERVGGRVEQLRIRGVSSEAERELGDDGRAGEARELGRELGPRTLDLEIAEGVEVAAGLDVELRATLSEEIERASEPAR